MFSFHTSMQGTTDLAEKMDSDPAIRLFNAYIAAKDIAGMLDVRIGRIPVFGGVSYGSVDGGQLKARPADAVEIMLYGGGLTPPSQRSDFFHHFEDNWQLGGQVELRMLPNTTLGLSYMNRHRESRPFDVTRYDPELAQNRTYHIDYGSRANQYGSFAASWGAKGLWTFGRLDYDFNFERLSRAEVSAYYQATEKLGCSLDFAHREPTISYNSYFSLFEAEANQEISAGVDYRLHRHLTLQGRVSEVLYDGENDTRIMIGAVNMYAALTYTKDISYDGDLDAFNFSFMYPLFEGRLTPNLGVVLSNYALGDDFEKITTWAGVAGAVYRPFRTLSFDIQGQYVSNKIYSSDIRGFIRVSYWFTKCRGAHDTGGER
jgi:hypothetical protein